MAPKSLRRLLLGLAVAAATLSWGDAQAKQWTRIRIASEGAYPPFNMLNADNQLEGFDVDVARAVCAAAKVSCEFVAQDWEGLIPALLAGKFDVVFASMSITAERRKVVAFSERYYASPALFVADKTSGLMDSSPRALAGRTLGAKSGTVNARYLEEVYAPAGAKVKLYATQEEANLDLSAGRLDAVLADKLVMLPWLKNAGDGDCCQVIGHDLADPAYFGEGVGAALRKQDADLKALIDGALAQIRADGTYERINARYFPFSIY